MDPSKGNQGASVKLACEKIQQVKDRVWCLFAFFFMPTKRTKWLNFEQKRNLSIRDLKRFFLIV